MQASWRGSPRIDQVNIAVSTMDEMTQQNAALAEQTSAASGALRDLMSFFRPGQPAGAPIASAPMPVGAAAAPTARRVEPSIAAVKTPAKPATAASAGPPPKIPGKRAVALPPVSPDAFDEDEWEEF